MVGRKYSREVNNLFGTEHHIEKINILRLLVLITCIFFQTILSLQNIFDFCFWFFTYFLEKKNICLNILFVFHCPFLLPFCSRTSLGSSFGVKSINSRNFIHAKICPLKQRNTWTILYLIWETISLIKTNWQRRCFEAQ